MTEAEAIAAADRVLMLINSMPRTPSKQVIAAAIGYSTMVDLSTLTAEEVKRIIGSFRF